MKIFKFKTTKIKEIPGYLHIQFRTKYETVFYELFEYDPLLEVYYVRDVLSKRKFDYKYTKRQIDHFFSNRFWILIDE